MKNKFSKLNSFSWRKIFSWLDDNILLITASFLIIFIPLYPKIPLAELIEGYQVRLRLEDVFVGIGLIIWLIQVIRKKIKWRTPLFVPILAYAVVGLLSTFSAVIISQTIPAEPLHIGKSLLHYFRYLEYFSIYLIVVSAIKKRRDFWILLWVIVGVVLAVTIYGYGQKYRYWPVYSTMNREFAKGVRLVLTEHARVQSTFGGHYDLGGYLLATLTIVFAFAMNQTKRLTRYSVYVVYFFGLWLLIMTAARTSYAGYLLAGLILLVYGAVSSSQKWSGKIFNFIKLFIVFILINTSLLLIFGDNMYSRLVQVIDSYPAVSQPYRQFELYAVEQFHYLNARRKDALAFLMNPDQFLAAKKPDNAVEISLIDQQTSPPVLPADTLPTPVKPSDVTLETPDYIQIATSSADGTTIYSTIEKPREYSDSALKFGLSLGIRLDTLWPRALQGYYTNPLLGSGYATLTKEAIGQFTEAESTDNNFLRTIGETGAFGFVTFYGLMIYAVWLAISLLKNSFIPKVDKWFAIAFIALTAGLWVNALYIDIFAASKVAFTYWSLTGILVGIYLLNNQEKSSINNQ